MFNHNPANFATRGVNVSEISDCSLWWYGPDWLQCNESKWPTWNLPHITSEKLENSLPDKEYWISSCANLVREASGEHKDSKLSVLGIVETNYSSLWKLLCITTNLSRMEYGVNVHKT